MSRTRPSARATLEDMLAQELAPPSLEALERAPVLTDDSNPIDELNADIMARWRKGVIETRRDLLFFEGKRL